jgi:hypothetical protein
MHQSSMNGNGVIDLLDGRVNRRINEIWSGACVLLHASHLGSFDVRVPGH